MNPSNQQPNKAVENCLHSHAQDATSIRVVRQEGVDRPAQQKNDEYGVQLVTEEHKYTSVRLGCLVTGLSRSGSVGEADWSAFGEDGVVAGGHGGWRSRRARHVEDLVPGGCYRYSVE